MSDIDENASEKYFKLQMEWEQKKYEYALERRPLVWFRNILLINPLIAAIAIVTGKIVGNDAYISGWCQTAQWIVGIFTVLLIFYFLNTYYWLIALFGEYRGDKFGFRGIERLKRLISLKEDIERLEIQLRVMKTHQTKFLTVEEQLELYKDELQQVIQEYKRKANRQRSVFFALQMVIIACSLFVGSLTSGLTSLISVLGNHWVAPAFSFAVSFLTAMVTLFRPREKGYNLQQTADAVEFEISCANKRIYGYEGLDDRQTFTKLAQEVEKMRNEQRKRQQQLEQSSETKQTSES
jgi:hypothetical protein